MANKITHTAKKRSNALSGAMLLVAGVNLGRVFFWVVFLTLVKSGSWWLCLRTKKSVGKTRGMKQRLGKNDSKKVPNVKKNTDVDVTFCQIGWCDIFIKSNFSDAFFWGFGRFWWVEFLRPFRWFHGSKNNWATKKNRPYFPLNPG